MDTCRICLEEDDVHNLIAPCLCAGTCKFVHRQCLDRWRVAEVGLNAFYQCPQCAHKYEFEHEMNSRECALAILRFILDSLFLVGAYIIILGCCALVVTYLLLLSQENASITPETLYGLFPMGALVTLAFIGVVVFIRSNDRPSIGCCYYHNVDQEACLVVLVLCAVIGVFSVIEHIVRLIENNRIKAWKAHIQRKMIVKNRNEV